MKPKSIVIATLLVVFVLGSSDGFAQDQEKEPMPPEERAAKLTN